MLAYYDQNYASIICKGLGTSQQAKIWLVVLEDSKKVYEKYAQGGAIILWCDGRCDDDNENARKRKRDV